MRRLISLFAAAATLCACGSAGNIVNVYSARDAEGIDVGYGTSSKDGLSYSVSQVKVEDDVVSYSNIWEYLRGKVPGVYIGDSAAGSTPQIIVRGLNSINSSTQPLIMVDGQETADISWLNPNDVASVSVLKDASASIYGSRGANGVILFTTKSAKQAAQAEAAAKKAAREAAKAAKAAMKSK